MSQIQFQSVARGYFDRLRQALDHIPLEPVEALADALTIAWQRNKQVFIFGNGGSAGNAIHLANDFLYGISKQFGHALRVTALPANSAVITCLANDRLRWDFCHQLSVLAEPGDIAIAFSGSGNSPNICERLNIARKTTLIRLPFLVIQVVKQKNWPNTLSMFQWTICRLVRIFN